MVKQKRGNYILYSPSYEYMMKLHKTFVAETQRTRTIVQSPNMTEGERVNFLKNFAQEGDETLVGFAVMGGIFGEGIDLVGDRLSGVVIVGVGLPGISPENEIIRGYFTQSMDAGYEFAYAYPGINRVFQAAGRVIRTDDDRGIVLLIDKRFSSPQYKALFPPEWHPLYVGTISELGNHIQDFWNG